MSEAAAPLGTAQLEQIGTYVRTHLNGWLSEMASPVAMDREILERIVRVEEELKHQHAIMVERFEAVDRRFEAVDKRFEDVNKRFEDVNKRFEDMNKRFEDMNKRFSGLQWMVGCGVGLLATMMTIFQFLGA